MAGPPTTSPDGGLQPPFSGQPGDYGSGHCQVPWRRGGFLSASRRDGQRDRDQQLHTGGTRKHGPVGQQSVAGVGKATVQAGVCTGGAQKPRSQVRLARPDIPGSKRFWLPRL